MRSARLVLALSVTLLPCASCVEDRPGDAIKPPAAVGDGGLSQGEGGAPGPGAAVPTVNRFHVEIYDRDVTAVECIADALKAMRQVQGGYSLPTVAGDVSGFGSGWASGRPGAALYAWCTSNPDKVTPASILMVGAWAIDLASNPVADQGRLAALAQELPVVGEVSPSSGTFPELRTTSVASALASELTQAVCVRRAADALQALFPQAEGGEVFSGADTGVMGWSGGRTVSVTCVGKPQVKAVLVHGFATRPDLDVADLVEQARSRVVR